jgi:hypothetical protein
MNELVERLTKTQHVIASLRPEPTLEYFKAAVDRGYVHIKFTETRGGTELGVRIDPARSDLSGADWANKSGSIKVAGELILDYVRVRCHATIDLGSLDGTGYLEVLEDEVQPGAAASSPASA